METFMARVQANIQARTMVTSMVNIHVLPTAIPSGDAAAAAVETQLAALRLDLVLDVMLVPSTVDGRLITLVHSSGDSIARTISRTGSGGGGGALSGVIYVDSHSPEEDTSGLRSSSSRFLRAFSRAFLASSGNSSLDEVMWFLNQS